MTIERIETVFAEEAAGGRTPASRSEPRGNGHTKIYNGAVSPLRSVSSVPNEPAPNEPAPSEPALSESALNESAEPAAMRRRQQVRHDIQHELATIALLAELVASAGDVGAASRDRVQLLIGEIRWLDQLVRRLDDEPLTGAPSALAETVEVDVVAHEVVMAMRLATRTRVVCHAEPAWAHVNRLALWRALRNVLDNACRAAGRDGHVDVSVSVASGWTIIEIDDDGPGFGRGPVGLASLGLGIVQDFVADCGGGLETRGGERGGGCIRILLPAARAPVPSSA